MPTPLPPEERSTARTSPVTHTRYLAIGAPDYGKLVNFYGSTWGLRPVADDTGVTFFAAEASTEQFVFRVREADERRVDLIAFAVSTPAEVDRLCERLGRDGVRIDRTPQPLITPGGGYGFRFFDPDGRLVEISCEVGTRQARELAEREDIPSRLSHVVFNTANLAAVIAFYERYLGFRVSDWVADRMVFMRCQRDHHTLGFAAAGHASLNHVSFEMRGIEEYMRGTGRMMRSGFPVLWGPGRHGPGDNTFSYFRSPDGNVVEYTTALMQVDEDTWVPCRWEPDGEEADQWGTANPIDEFIPVAIGESDPGLWTAPPL